MTNYFTSNNLDTCFQAVQRQRRVQNKELCCEGRGPYPGL